MKIEEIKEKVDGFLVEEFEIAPETIQPQAKLQDTLNLDSLDYVDLVVIIESTFGFKVQGEDFKGINTFNDFYSYIKDNLQKTA